MNKQDLTNLVVQKTGLTKKDTYATIDAAFKTIAEVMLNGEEVAIPHFGKFKVYTKGARHGVNPQTGDSIMIPAHKVPKFEPSSILKNAVKE